jgi:tyrosyl-tRNA synthetase
MTLSEELQWRGQIKDATFSDLTWLDDPKTFYLGADCASADSLTIGNLAIFLMAKRLAKAGWKTVLLVGGATSLIGDPGGKETERDIKPREEIEANVAGIKAQVEQLFRGIEFTLVDNYDWFKDIGYLQFLREVGKSYSMTELLQRDYIATRLGADGNGISYAEFSYSLIQGYDFWHLYREHGVVMQIGGSDQWGNMLSGVPLIRKKENAQVHALSMPLVINQATGKKFGKSEEGAIWLDPQKTTPTQLYQFWINVDDAGVEGYLKIYTEFEKGEIDRIMEAHTHDMSARHAQMHLAREVTKLVHGQEQTQLAELVTGYLTGASPVAGAEDNVLEVLRKEIPSVGTHEDGSILQALVDASLADSISEARRLLRGNAIALDGVKVDRETFAAIDFHNGRLLLKKGKKFSDTALVELHR